jgi:hypothetical protein
MTLAYYRRHLLRLADDCAAAGMWATARFLRRRAARLQMAARGAS